MARVGIGVPVFNGGELLRQSLECLRTQSFEDIEVLIGDNASDDRTAEICAGFAARDSRFRHLRRPENIGALANFVDLLARSEAELFMWRAHDDLSDANYVEALAGLLDRDPAIDLAVGNVASRPDDRARPRVYPWRPPPSAPRIARIVHQLFASHASWIYGLWRRPVLQREQARVDAVYSHPWGGDHLTCFPLILDGRIGGTRATGFTQRIIRAGTTRAERQARRPGIGFMRALRAEFAAVAWAEIDRRDFSPAGRAVLAAVMPTYIDRRAYPRAKLMRRTIRYRLGLAPDRP